MARQESKVFHIYKWLGNLLSSIIDWTRTHGFFILMGGFYLFDGDIACFPLSQEKVQRLIETGQYTPPSEDELDDRSKGDALSKAIILVQTLWFVTQCIARGTDHLPITELEIVTLAYTPVILGMYGFWWNKPLSVRQPIRIQKSLIDDWGVHGGSTHHNHIFSPRKFLDTFLGIFSGKFTG